MNKKKWLHRLDQLYRDTCNIILNDDDDFANSTNDIINTTVSNKPCCMSAFDSLPQT